MGPFTGHQPYIQSDKMAVRQLVVLVCLMVVVAAREPQSRLVETDALPNNIFDTLVNGLVNHFRSTGQGQSRPLPEKTAQIPYNVGGEKKFITIKMSGQLRTLIRSEGLDLQGLTLTIMF